MIGYELSYDAMRASAMDYVSQSTAVLPLHELL
jgi:hypothetical protein